MSTAPTNEMENSLGWNAVEEMGNSLTHDSPNINVTGATSTLSNPAITDSCPLVLQQKPVVEAAVNCSSVLALSSVSPHLRSASLSSHQFSVKRLVGFDQLTHCPTEHILQIS